MRRRVLAAVAAVVVLVGIAAVYTAQAARRERGTASGGQGIELKAGQLLFRDMAVPRGKVAAAPLGGQGRTVGSAGCVRFYAAAGTAVCLRPAPAAVPSTFMLVLDRRLREIRRVPLTGVPSRAKVSASGRMVSWTVFVQGDSYNGASFSTRTGILDTRTGRTVSSLEDIALTVNGRRYRSPDVNFWGVTFTGDDDRFYATASTKGKTYLVEGDFGRWTARAIRENVECPSLSPDGSRLAFKKRVSRDPAKPWRLYALDLKSGRETALAERHSVDDQAAWLDDRTVMYGLTRDGGGSDVWAVPADGSGAPRVLVANAASPSVLR